MRGRLVGDEDDGGTLFLCSQRGGKMRLVHGGDAPNGGGGGTTGKPLTKGGHLRKPQQGVVKLFHRRKIPFRASSRGNAAKGETLPCGGHVRYVSKIR